MEKKSKRQEKLTKNGKQKQVACKLSLKTPLTRANSIQVKLYLLLKRASHLLHIKFKNLISSKRKLLHLPQLSAKQLNIVIIRKKTFVKKTKRLHLIDKVPLVTLKLQEKGLFFWHQLSRKRLFLKLCTFFDQNKTILRQLGNNNALKFVSTCQQIYVHKDKIELDPNWLCKSINFFVKLKQYDLIDPYLPITQKQIEMLMNFSLKQNFNSDDQIDDENQNYKQSNSTKNKRKFNSKILASLNRQNNNVLNPDLINSHHMLVEMAKRSKRNRILSRLARQAGHKKLETKKLSSQYTSVRFINNDGSVCKTMLVGLKQTTLDQFFKSNQEN